VKKAPNLRKLEIRRPVNGGLGIHSQDEAPSEWKQVIPKLAPLKKLAELILTFPAAEEKPNDAGSIEVARTLMRNKFVVGERRLVVRNVVARHYTNEVQEEDVLQSHTETFE
jgi:hypothetical protein